jgi:3-oxoacyl-(acyl-carrier-protein) synthase
MDDRRPYRYIDEDLPPEEVLALLGELPKRWGRMDRISRLAVVEAGRALKAAGILRFKKGLPVTTGRGGLIGVTRRGSLATDLAYAETFKQGPELASPILFSYTLPNTALAEAASHYSLTGPVYSLFSEEEGTDGSFEARRWLDEDPDLDFMVAGVLDVYPDLADSDVEIISVNFKIVS